MANTQTHTNISHPYGLTSDELTQQYGPAIMHPNSSMRRVDNVSGASSSALPRAASASVMSGKQQHSQKEQQQHSKNPTIDTRAMAPHGRPQNDELEYYIKFPAQGYRTAVDIGEPKLIFTHGDDETHVPIVVLLGWAGCQDRYLMKYSKIYEDRGLITIRYTAPVDTLFWNRTEMISIGEKILKLIQDMNFDAHPMIIHVFSNGGAYLYQHISLAMRKHNTPLQLRGVIFDSAPGERRILGLYRAVSAIYGRDQRKCNCLTAIVITLSLSIMWFVEETFNAFKCLFVKAATPLQSGPFGELKNDPNNSPQLFLYSKGDMVIPYQDIEKFIKARKTHGVDVSAVSFEDAEHVKIFTKYPAEYVKCICNFVNNCFSLPAYSKDAESNASLSPTPTIKTDVNLGAAINKKSSDKAMKCE